jgi:methionyl-tRNA formyltransferase
VIWHGHGTAFIEEVQAKCPGVQIANVDVVKWGEIASLLTEYNVDVAVVAGFSRVIPQWILRIPRLGFINLHGGPVPAYRGGSPLNWQLINDEVLGGVSILRVTSGIDDGDVVASSVFPIEATDQIQDLHHKAERELSKQLIEVMMKPELIERATPQETSGATYWHQRSDADGQVMPRFHSADLAMRMVRALSAPYPAAWIKRGNDIFRLREVSAPLQKFRGTPGRIVRVPGGFPVLVMSEGAIELKNTVMERGSRELSNGDIVDSH